MFNFVHLWFRFLINSDGRLRMIRPHKNLPRVPDCGVLVGDLIMRLPLFAKFLVLGFAANFALVAQTAPLPKIRIAKDGRTFVTETGQPFVPLGVNYYRPDTGWAPQVWKKFDAEATRKDFARMKELGVNCIRIFLTFNSFYTDPGVLRQEGLDKFDQFLAMAEESGIYVHPTGPDHWEGRPNWKPVAIADDHTLQYIEAFWKLFATRYRGRSVIFAYDLRNEPHVPWNNEILIPKWNDWLKQKYRTTSELKKSWGATNDLLFGQIALPVGKDVQRRTLLDFQYFREDIADEWTRRQAAAIKASDPNALTTVGYLQTSVPTRFWSGVEDYTGFRAARQAKYLDFMEIHFYPSERGGYEYKSEDDELANMAYLEGIVREMARPGKPVVLAEFGWYGSKEKPKFDRGVHPLATEAQQAKYMRRAIETSKGFVTGWLNWGLYDCPAATDCSELTGLLTASGETKEWGKEFQKLSAELKGQHLAPKKTGPRPAFDWDAAITNAESGREFRKKYFEAFMAERKAKGAH
jgi:hypothetical protein